jgi:type IV pilus biogenesis protein CpaD/CtpE
MKQASNKLKAATLAGLLVCAQGLLAGCASTSNSTTSVEDDAKLAKAQKMADRFESRPRGIAR